MGNCPYCRSVTLPGDTICYSCGRVLANIKSKQFAAEQQFNQGSLDTTYMKTRKPSKSGVVMTHKGKRKTHTKKTEKQIQKRSYASISCIHYAFTSSKRSGF